MSMTEDMQAGALSVVATPLPMSHRHLRPLSVAQRPEIAIPALSQLLGLLFMLSFGSSALWVRRGDSQEVTFFSHFVHEETVLER